MESFVKTAENKILEGIKKIGFDTDKVLLSNSTKPELGQFQFNGVMAIAKRNGKNPVEVANALVDVLKEDKCFESLTVAGPGFINITFNNEYLLEYMNKCLNDFDNFIDVEEPKTIIVDYGGANAAKALHIGHMRSANIGEALKRLALVYKNNVIGDVHLGDVGRQSGMVISELMLEQPDLPYFKEDYIECNEPLNLTIDDLGRLYPAASNKAKEDENKMEEVRRITAEVDKGTKRYLDLWKKIVDISSIQIKSVYNYLNCTFDLWEGELDSYKYIDDTIKVLKPYMYESEGAYVIDVKKEDDKLEIPPLIVIKTDGSTIYATRDLATMHSRMTRFNPDEMWYFTDKRQGMYFEQCFRAAYTSGLVKQDTKLEFYGFGTMNGKDGKPFKTRDGGVMTLDSLIQMVKDVADTKLKEDIKGKEREDLVNKITVAILKFGDLLPVRNTDYNFDLDKVSSVEGKTGPYILYTAVRIKSIFNKLGDVNNSEIKVISSKEEENIIVKLIELTKVLKTAYDEKNTGVICDYLFNLCNLYNKFYSEHNIVNEENNEIKESWIALSKLVYQVIEKLLDILAIEIPDRM
jgi:arginyl-tRNA synthetase